MADEIDLVSDINSGELDNAPMSTPAGTVPAQGADAVPAQGKEAVQANQAPAPAAKPTDNLRDQLTSAFRAQDGTPTDQQQAQANDGVNRHRSDGTFKSAEELAAEQAAAAASTAAQPVTAPQWFAPEDAAKFNALPPEMQSLVARTVASVEEVAARYQGYEQIETLIGPRRQAWALNGMSEGQAINQLFAISDFATQRPAEFIGWFAQSQGIDLNALLEQGVDEQDIDPVVAELRSQVQSLTGQLQSFTHGQQQTAHNNVVNEVAAFARETGEGGTALRPYLPELGSGFLPYIQQVKAEQPSWPHKQVLQEAYERACWGTPSIRAKLLAAQEADKLAEQRAAAARASHAGSSVTGDAPSTGATVPNNPGNGSVRDELRQQFSAYH